MHLYTHRGAEGGLGPDHAHHQQAHQGAAKALGDQPTYEHTIQNFNPPSQYLTHIWVAICEQQLVVIHNTIYTSLSHPPKADRRAFASQEDVHPHWARSKQMAGAPACSPQDPGAEDGAI